MNYVTCYYRKSLYAAYDYSAGCRAFVQMQKVKDPEAKQRYLRFIRCRFEPHKSTY